MKVLVATDGSEPAGLAVSWAADLAAATGAEVVAATVIEEAGSATTADREKIAQLLEHEWTSPLAARGVACEYRVLDGDPRTALVRRVHRSGVDAVVVGTRGAGGFLGLGLGSVAHYLAHHLRCPLVAVPHMGGPLTGGALVVGADGSAANEPALRFTADLAKQLGAHAVALFVHSALADVMTHTAANWRYPGEDDVRAAAGRAGADGARIDVVLAAGNPTEELMRAAAENDAALTVVGRRGWGGLKGMVLGRVPTQLLHHTERPIAIVPH